MRRKAGATQVRAVRTRAFQTGVCLFVCLGLPAAERADGRRKAGSLGGAQEDMASSCCTGPCRAWADAKKAAASRRRPSRRTVARSAVTKPSSLPASACALTARCLANKANRAAAAASAGTAVRSEPCRTELRAVVRSTLRQPAAACCMMRTGVKECARKLRSDAAPVIRIMRGRSSRGSGAYTLT